MSYRTYIAIVDKKIINNLRKCKSIDDLKKTYDNLHIKYEDCSDEEIYITPYQLPVVVDYELGEVEYSFLEDQSTPLFDCKSISPDFEEYWEYYNVRFGKEDMILSIIKEYKKKVLLYYKNLLNNEVTTFLGNKEKLAEGDTEEETDKLHYKYLLNEIRGKITEWGMLDGTFPVNTNKNSPFVSHSWLYEYAIHNLAVMYKMYNPKKHYVLYYGY